MKQGDDLIGMAVVKAARVMGIAAGGQILSLRREPRAPRDPQRGSKSDPLVGALLKGIEKKEHVFEVAWRESSG